MTKIGQLFFFSVLFVLAQPYFAGAAVEDPVTGDVELVWTVDYIPFSWKFSVDPFPITNGSLSMQYPSRASFEGVQPSSSDYEVLSQGFDNTDGLVANIQFKAGPEGPPSGDSVVLFDILFDDMQQGAPPMDSQEVTFGIFARDNDGFNFPVDSEGNILWDLEPAITPAMIQSYFAPAPVPEPASFLLVTLGALGVLAFRRRA